MGINLGQMSMKAVYLGQTAVKSVFFGNNQVWSGEEPGQVGDWLCFTAEQANSTVRLNKDGSPDVISLETSTDGNTWTNYSWTGSTGDTLTLANVGDKVMFRASSENSTISKTTNDYYLFVITGQVAASGNIQTLLKADGTRTDAPAYCYYDMFSGTSLTTAPALPATTLGSYCYSSMFADCTSLTSAPALPATTLATYCYSDMFHGCTSLTTAPALPATSTTQSCYQSMFHGCTSLTTAPALPAKAIADYCYSDMFNGCTSLTTAPALPATATALAWAYYCYNNMFRNCTSLSSVEVAFTAWPGNGSTNNWLNNVAASGTFICPSTLPDTRGSNKIPTGWTKTAIGHTYTWYKYAGDTEWRTVSVTGEIGDSSISDFNNVVELEIGTGVTSIGEYAFDWCTNLTNVTIPDSVTNIGYEAFGYCSGLTSVTIGNGVTSIGNFAFVGCGLTSVTIPDSVTSIESGAFLACNGLTSMTIGNGVTSIGGGAFQCDSLTNVTFSGKDKATVQGMASYSWALPSGCIIHCTDGDITI